jgi:hypothetical protein
MRMFDTVVLVCDQYTLDIALAIRSMLELFRLRAHLLFCVQKQNVLDALGGQMPEADYVVLCAGALLDQPERTLSFRVVDQVEGQWQEVAVILNRETVPRLVDLPGRTVISLGCEAGDEPLANAFLDTGCKAYIGSSRPVDQDAVAMFATAFFYHLLVAERDRKLTCSDAEAVQLAASLDERCPEGTAAFRYFTRDRGASLVVAPEEE